MKRVVLILLGVGLLAGASIFIFPSCFIRSALNAQLRDRSPYTEFFALALPFKGRNPHPLDGKLRLFIGEDTTIQERYQTTLPVSCRTYLEWLPNATPPTFRIRDQHGTRMVWRMEGRKAVCVEGQEFLTSDPYAVQDAPAE